MSRINTNVPAMQAFHRLRTINMDLETRLQRLSTGLRINRGRDDPAGLIASENLRAEMGAIRQAMDNSTRASNVLSTAEGALHEVSDLLLDLQHLVVATANEAGLTEEEVNANQLEVDSILASIDRIADTTRFSNEKLLDGSKGYFLSGVPPAALASVEVYGAYLPRGNPRLVNVEVTQSAHTAKLTFVGGTIGGVSTTSAATIELRGRQGADTLSFASGATLAQMATAINTHTAITGVSAVVSSTAGQASALVLQSTAVGSDAFVSVSPIAGNFVTAGTAGITLRDTGMDAGVLIDGQRASVKGLRADVRSAGLDIRVDLTRPFGQTLSAASFAVSGGGAIFQLTPRVKPNGQIFAGLNSVRTTSLGNPVTGLLYSLHSGRSNDFKSKNFATAQDIVDEAISQIATYRGRLGTLQRDHIDPNVASQQVTLENVTASESIIRDADMAVEVSALTRAQILVQSTQTTLRIANSIPNLVLDLLG